MVAVRKSSSVVVRKTVKYGLLAVAAAAAAGSLMGALPAQAATFYWRSAAGTATWATASNWSTTGAGGAASATAPTNDLTTDVVDFDGTTYAFQPTATTGGKISGIIIGDGTTSTAALTITTSTGVNRLQLGANGIMMNANSGAATIGNATTQGILVGANQTWENDSSNLLTVASVSGVSSTAPAVTLTMQGSGSGGIAVTNVISDAGGTGTVALGINMSGTGAVTLSGINTFTGGVTLTGGTLIINNTKALGAATGTFTINGGTVDTVAAGIAMGNANPITIGGNFIFGGTGNLNMSTGAVGLGGATRTINTVANTFTLGGIISNGGITKTGAGTLAINGVNTFSGGLTINNGTVSSSATTTPFGSGGTIVLGDGSTSNPATLLYTGTGTAVSNPITVNAGGTGTLTIEGNTNTNTFTGTVALNNNLTVDNLNATSKTTTFSNTWTEDSGARVITKGTGASSVTISGLINMGTGGLTVTNTGAGPLLLSGGVTGPASATATLLASTSSTGSLTIGNINNGTSGVTALSVTGGTLVSNGTSGAFSGGTTVAANATISTAADANTGTGGLTLAGTSGNPATLTATTGYTLGSGKGVTLGTAAAGSGGTFNVGAVTLTIAGAISNSSGGTNILNVTGTTGTLILSNTNNSYTGGTLVTGGAAVQTSASDGATSPLGASTGTLTLDNGILKAGATLTLTRGIVLNAGGGTLNSGSTSPLTVNGLVSGSGLLTITNNGSVTLTNTNNSFSGGVMITGGALDFTDDRELGSTSGTVAGAGGANIYVNNANGTPGLNATGITGNVTVSSSRIIAVGTSVNADLSANGANSSNQTTLTFGGVIQNYPSVAGILVIAGTNGTVMLSGNNTYSGATNINGSLGINADAALGASSAPVNLKGTLMPIPGTGTVTLATTRTIVLTGGTGTLSAGSGDTLSIGDVISGSGQGLSIAGAGTIAFTGAGNTYNGATLINSGSTLSVSSNANLGATSTFDINNGTLAITGTDTFTVPMAIGPNATGTSSSTAFVNVSGSNTATLSSVISNWSSNVASKGLLTKQGTGTLILTNSNNTYTGATEIDQGVLVISTDSDLGTVPSAATARSLNFGVSGNAVLKVTSTMTLNANRGIGGLTGVQSVGPVATIDVTSGNVLTYNGIIANSGSGVTAFQLVKADLGELDLGGVSTYTGGTVVNAGILSATAALGGAGSSITVNPTGMAGNSTDTATLFSTNNAIGSSAAVTVNTNSPTAIGTIQINDAAQTIGSLSGSGSVVLANGGGTVLTVSGSTSTAFSGVISQSGGTASLSKAGTSTLTLSGTNTYGGTTTISAGSLQVGSDSNLGIGGNVALAGGTLLANASFTLSGSRGVSVGPSGTTGGAGTINVPTGLVLTYGGVVSSGGTGADSLTLNGAGTVVLGGASTYNGSTTLTGGGLLQITGGDDRIPTTTSLILTSGTFDLNSHNQTVTNLSGTGTVTNSVASTLSTLTISGSPTFGGVIQNGAGTVAVTLTGSGVTGFNGANTYTGVTTIQQGGLQLGATASLASSKIIVGDTPAHSSANFDVSLVTAGFHVTAGQTLAGHGSVTGAVTVDSGADLSPGNSIGTTTYNGALTESSGSNLDYDFGPALTNHTFVAGSSDTIAIAATGTLTFTGTVNLNLLSGDTNFTTAGTGSYELFSYATPGSEMGFVPGDGVTTGTIRLGSGWSGLSGMTFSITDDTTAQGIFLDFSPSVVTPEPTSLALLGLGAAGMLARRRRR